MPGRQPIESQEPKRALHRQAPELHAELGVDAQSPIALHVEPELQAYAWELYATALDFNGNEREPVAS